MRIYSMTATFGKLENQTLSFQEGLNVIHAPNEWGKSTWCAFLVSMLYGIDTKERTTQGSLADKDRYTPWSGSPMAGRIDLCWNGRDITIERQTKGRVPFGVFQAYETGTGLPVPELIGANCGQLLLGVEKSVFTRSGFIRLTDLPVGNDDALRRRLNSLVTTGDESGASDTLAQKLKELKNRCRHNKTGLLPQLEAQRDTIAEKLQQLRQLREQDSRITGRRETVSQQIRFLENHLTALAYEAAREDECRVSEANAALEEAKQNYLRQRELCDSLPGRETAEENILQLEQLRMEQDMLRDEPLPAAPEMPDVPHPFMGLTPAEALEQARKDAEAHAALSKFPFPLYLILALATFGTTILAMFYDWKLVIPMAILTVVLTYGYFKELRNRKLDREEIEARYEGIIPTLWMSQAVSYGEIMTAFAKLDAAYISKTENRQARLEALEENIAFLTGGCPIGECLDTWRENLDMHSALDNARHTYEQAKAHAQAVASMAKAAPAPDFADELTYTAAETQQLLVEAQAEQRQLHLQQGHISGQMEALGNEGALQQQRTAIQAKIHRLENIYSATVLAMETLSEASAGLQRKFAPRISRRAQALFSRLTDSRYDRLLLGEDLSVQTGAQGEVALRSGLWRSDGTADQQYLALRLAVAAELTPDAPLLLDDALVRFDETRLKLAMDILKEEAKTKQVILFTCQGREQKYL